MEIETEDGNPKEWDWWELIASNGNTEINYVQTINRDTHPDQAAYVRGVVKMVKSK
jgi:hypothetical protein